MLQTLKPAIRSQIRRFGWDITRFDPLNSPSSALVRMLATHQVETVLDIGAHEGEFAMGLKTSGYPGRIVSFEPSREAHRKLAQASRQDPNWIVADRMAIGAKQGPAVLHISGNGQSSSILPMLPDLVQSAPECAYVGVETVAMSSLDRVYSQFDTGTSKVFLKIDVQGYETDVLDGAMELLRNKVVGLQVELSLVPLYDGQAPYEAVYGRLVTAGFELWNLSPVFADRATGRLLQMDGVFFRRPMEAVVGS